MWLIHQMHLGVSPHESVTGKQKEKSNAANETVKAQKPIKRLAQ